MRKHKRNFLVATLLVGVLLCLHYFISFDPTVLVDYLGVRNAYIAGFVVSLFGGFSAGGSVALLALIIAFVEGGVDPLILSIICGLGLGLGDMALLMLGRFTRSQVEGEWDEKITRFADYIAHSPILSRLMPYAAFLYVACTPFPNDIMIFFLAAIKYDLKKTAFIVVVGGMVFIVLLTWLVHSGLMTL